MVNNRLDEYMYRQSILTLVMQRTMCLRESRSTSTEFASDVLGLFAASKLGGVGGF